MSFAAITIRPAEYKDIDGIWHLLHAECKGWSDEEIQRNLPLLFVLTRQDKLLGVLWGELMHRNVKIMWIVIHPLYAEGPLKQVFIQFLRGIGYIVADAEKRTDPPKDRWMVPCLGELGE
jgi:hypothetical protein